MLAANLDPIVASLGGIRISGFSLNCLDLSIRLKKGYRYLVDPGLEYFLF